MPLKRFTLASSLDARARWSSALAMARKGCKLQEAFEGICSSSDWREELSGARLPDEGWNALRALAALFEGENERAILSSSKSTPTDSLQALICSSLEPLCKNSIADGSSPSIKKAAEALLQKLEKRKKNLSSPLSNLAQPLDLRASSKPEKALELKSASAAREFCKRSAA